MSKRVDPKLWKAWKQEHKGDRCALLGCWNIGEHPHHIIFGKGKKDDRFGAMLCWKHHMDKYAGAHGIHSQEIQVILLRDLCRREPEKKKLLHSLDEKWKHLIR